MTFEKNENLKVYLPSQQIQSLNRALAQKISADYSRQKSGSELLIVVTLKGALFFASDLLREIDLPLQIDFVRVASYGGKTKSSGTVRLLKDIESPPEGRDILVLDEIVDSGHTLSFLIQRFRSGSPKSLKVCTLLNKPSRREVEVPIDYCGMEIDDKFLVGYGLDFNEKYRNLPDIYYLEE